MNAMNNVLQWLGTLALITMYIIMSFFPEAYRLTRPLSPHAAAEIEAAHRQRKIAGLMGIDINRTIALTFLLGGALAGAAGLVSGLYNNTANFQMGFSYGLNSFTAAVLGGIGNLNGAMLGGVVLGLVESLGAGYIGDLTGNVFGSNYQDVFAFFVLILVLTLRPSGLLGERVSDRA